MGATLCIANLGDLMDRQMALLVDVKFNNGLPSNLSGAEKSRAMINHGFKAVQIGMSAWTAEALKLTMPASVFSRSTECHNQGQSQHGDDRGPRLPARPAAHRAGRRRAAVLGVTQALELRHRQTELSVSHLAPAVRMLFEDVLGALELLTENRPLKGDLRRTVGWIQGRRWEL